MGGVCIALEVHVVVPNLEVDADEVDERDVVSVVTGTNLGKSRGQ